MTKRLATLFRTRKPNAIGRPWLACWSLFLAAFASTVMAQEEPPGSSPTLNARPPASGSDVVRASLWIVEGKVEAGEIFTLALVLEIAPSWHVYWRNPGDSGFAPTLSLTPMGGFEPVGDLAFPRPSILGNGEIVYGYEGKVALFQRVRAPKELPENALIGAKAKWMACKSICLTGEAVLNLQATPVAAKMSRPTRDIVDAARFQLPTPLSAQSVWSVESIRDQNGAVTELSIRGKTASKLESARAITFIPDVTPGVTHGDGGPIAATLEAIASGSAATIRIPITVDAANALGKPLRAAGLILIGDGTNASDHCYSVEVPLDAGASK